MREEVITSRLRLLNSNMFGHSFIVLTNSRSKDFNGLLLLTELLII